MTKAKVNNDQMEKLDKEETRVRAILAADGHDIEELQSEWQETDSPSERNLREVEWNQYSSLSEELTEIRDAKQRINDGKYGICTDCGEKISKKRLESVPTASRCVACQSDFEKESSVTDRIVTL